MDAFEADGIWYFPDAQQRRIAGVMRYSPKEGVHVKLTGVLRGDDIASTITLKSERYPLIFGVLNSGPVGRFVTLKDCFQTKLNIAMPGTATEEIYANTAVAGECHLHNKDFAFNEFIAEFENLAGWIPLVHFDFKHNDDHSTIEATCRRSPPVTVNTCDGAVMFEPQVNLSQKLGEELTIAANVRIRGTLQKPVDIEKASHKALQPIRDFLTLAIGRPVYATHLQVRNLATKNASKNSPSYMDVLDRVVVAEQTPRHTHPAEMLLRSQDLGDERLKNVIRQWYEFHRNNWWFCTMYFGQEYRNVPYIDVRFRLLLEAMICFLRYQYVSGHTRDFPPNATTMNIHGDWFYAVSPDPAEADFGPFLYNELSRFHGLMTPLLNMPIDEFIVKITRTLARLKHRGSRETESECILSGAALHDTIETLKVLCQAWMFEGAGMSVEEIVQMFGRSLAYNQRVTSKKQAK